MAVISKGKKTTPSRINPVVVIAVIIAIGLVVWLDVGDNYDLQSSSISLTSIPSVNATSAVRGTSTASGTRNWIWEELQPREREVAMADAMKYLEKFVNMLNKTKQDQWVSQEKCEVELFGSKWGTHQLCKIPPPEDCHFISFGISVDYSFDTDLAERWHCHGFAADPTIVHKSQLHDLVTFHNIAAKTLKPNEEARTAKRPWWVASVPAVKKFLGLKHINILKMDCEGCGELLSNQMSFDPACGHHLTFSSQNSA